MWPAREWQTTREPGTPSGPSRVLAGPAWLGPSSPAGPGSSGTGQWRPGGGPREMADTRSSDTIPPNTMAGGCACAAACTTSESATYGGSRARGPPPTRPPPRPSRTPSQEAPSLGGRCMPLPSTRRAPGRGPQVRAYPAMSWSWTRLSPGPTGQPAPEPSPQAQVTQARWSPGRAAASRRQLLTRDPLAAPPLPCGRLAYHTGVRWQTDMRCTRTPRHGRPAEPREAPPGPRAGGMTHPSGKRAETSPMLAPA